MKHSSPGSCDPQTAFLSANAFLSISEAFFAKMPKDKNASAHYALQNFGPFIAASTNLALAVELYLKCLAMISGLPVKHTHKLALLLNELPKETQDTIDRVYRTALSQLSIVEVEAIEVAKGPKPPEETALPASKATDEIRLLLEQEEDAYVNWRYVFEDKQSFLRLNFRSLRICASVLRTFVAGALKKK